MTSRRFAVTTVDDTDPTVFTLEGTHLDGTPWSETFTVLPELPGGALADLAASASINNDGNLEWNRLAVLRFVRAVIVEGDEARWDALMRDKQRPIDLDRIGPVMFFITEEKANRPTGPRPSSPDGSRNGQTGSTAVSSPPAEEPERTPWSI